MISLTKQPPPDVVADRLRLLADRLASLIDANEDIPDYAENAYREPAVKALVKAEAHDKCAYCESKVTHVYYGDIEHITPKSIDRKRLTLDYNNFTLACAICNNKKGTYYDPALPLLNPYQDKPEDHLIALGPMIKHLPGNMRSRFTVGRLELNRIELIERRRERIEQICSLADVYVSAPPGPLRELLEEELLREASDEKEFAFIVRGYLAVACGLNWTRANRLQDTNT